MNDSLVKNSIFNQNEIDNFVAFSSTLKRIHNRLISEGYVIEQGKIYKPEGDNNKLECDKIKT